MTLVLIIFIAHYVMYVYECHETYLFTSNELQAVPCKPWNVVSDDTSDQMSMCQYMVGVTMDLSSGKGDPRIRFGFNSTSDAHYIEQP